MPASIDFPYDAKCLFLSMPRVELFQRTDARCETIIENGLIEVRENNSSKYTEQQNHCSIVDSVTNF